MKSIREILEGLGYNPAEDETADYQNKWYQWYQGFVKDFHKYDVYNGVALVNKERHTLGMAKTVSEDWADLLMNEKVRISTGTDYDDELNKILESNNFRVKANQLVELAFALGTGAFVQYLDGNGQVEIDYIRAGMIFPLSWDNGTITECAFGSLRERGGKKQYYIQIHKLASNGTYIIENILSDAEDGGLLSLDEGMAEVVNTGIDIPLFQIVTPNIINNIDIDSPYGISVFGNALSQLKGCDLVFDSYINEFNLGKKRIIVPLSMAKIQMGENGATRPVFDNDDTTFYAVPGSRDRDGKIESIDPTIRSTEHEIGINKALDLLSLKCGMGTGRYKFENGSVKTATEVISDKSELYQSLQKHELLLESALTSMVRSIGKLQGKDLEEITVEFDDSIIQDTDSERKEDRLDVSMGVMSHWEYRAKWYGETEEEAKKNLPETADVD